MQAENQEVLLVYSTLCNHLAHFETYLHLEICVHMSYMLQCCGKPQKRTHYTTESGSHQMMSQSRQLTVPFPSSHTYRDREREKRGMGTLRLTFFLQLSDYGVLSSVHGPTKADMQAMITCFFKRNRRVMTAHCVLSITWHYHSLGYLPKASLYTKPVLPCKMGQGAAEKEIS